MPTSPSTKRVTERLHEKIADGHYKIGCLIVPQKFEKITLKDGKIQKEEIEVCGRKINLLSIRNDMYHQQKKYMRLRPNKYFDTLSREEVVHQLKTINGFNSLDCDANTEVLTQRLKMYERTRYLIFWHDGSSLSSHSHILIMVSCLYDTAVFVTDEEYFKSEGSLINIQARIEKPFLYSTDQQLLYSDERLSDILEIKKPLTTTDGKAFKVRAFKGDHPASQFEAGQQKGGNYACHGCCINSNCAKSLPHSFKCNTLSLSDRIKKILASTSSKQRLQNNTIIKLFDHLSLPELMDEHQQHKIQSPSLNKQSLQASLDMTMHGIQRMPALLFPKPFAKLEDLNLERYEILINEPLHDISNHIKNIQQEIPYHVPKEKKSLVKEIINTSFNGKDAKNAADYRKSMLLVTNWFLSNIKNHFTTNILLTLSEIQEILYLPETKRSAQKLMRLISRSFLHALFLKINIEGKIKSATERKFFGIYYHSLIRHSCEQYRVFSGRSANTEKEEATFNTLKTFTNLTSNHHPQNVIFNSLVRLQAKEILAAGENEYDRNKEIFSTLYQPIKSSFSNTLILFNWIKTYPSFYQVMLEQVADFLIGDNKCWEETQHGVLFFDLDIKDIDIKFHHFRSSSIVGVSKYLKDCWSKCLLNSNSLIPAQKIKIYNESTNKYESKSLQTSTFFKNSSTENSVPVTATETSNASICFKEVPKNETRTLLSKHDSNVNGPLPDFSIIESSISENKTSNAPLTDTHNNSLTNTVDCKLFQKVDLTLTSTPAPKTQKMPSKNHVISIKPIMENHETTFCNTTKRLIKVFGEQEYILEYDKRRKMLKSNKSNENLARYRGIIAQIEVKIVCEEDNLKKELKNLELIFLKDSNNTSIQPHCSSSNGDRTLYDCIIQKLQHIKVIRKTIF